MKPKVNYILIALIMASLCVGLPAVMLLTDGPRSLLGFPNKAMQEKYDQIVTGIPREVILESLGEPLRSKEEFCLPSGHEGYEESLNRANDSNAVAYDLWLNGINWYYCIGFDEDGLVAFKAEGND